MVKKTKGKMFDKILKFYKDNEVKMSFLINNPIRKEKGGGHESYGPAYIINIDKDFIYLDLPHNKRLVSIIIKKSLILSIWIYRYGKSST